MTDFERVIELASKLGTVVINNKYVNITINIDTYDIYNNILSIGDLNGNEINIYSDDILNVYGDRLVILKNFTLEFDSTQKL